jgi:spermidine/putrescine transport system permease protein
MVFFSFNSTESTGVFTGLSLKWYKSLFEDADGSIKSALIYSITLAVTSSIVATFIGTLAALGLSKFKRKEFCYEEKFMDCEDRGSYRYVGAATKRH